MGILVSKVKQLKDQASSKATTISMLVGADKKSPIKVKFLEIVEDINQDGKERTRVKVTPLEDGWVGTYGNGSLQGGQAAKAEKSFFLPFALVADIFDDITTIAEKDASGADIPSVQRKQDVNPETVYKVLITSTSQIATKV